MIKNVLLSAVLGLSMLMVLGNDDKYANLSRIHGVSEEVYASPGHEKLALHLASLLEDANRFMSELVDKPAPRVTLLVLSQEDWGKYTNPQLIYGMPHYGGSQGGTLIVAAEDNDFWRANMPPLHAMTPEQQKVFRQVYTNEAGELSVRPFFDLLALHELGHGWTGHHRVKRQQFWLEEVFANLLLHTFIAERHPDLLPALEVLPMVMAGSNRERFQYTSLSQFEEGYWIIGRDAPVNYGWYQFRFHYAAKQVYDLAGPLALRDLWIYYAGLSEPIDITTLVNDLHHKVHPAMADVFRRWDD